MDETSTNLSLPYLQAAQAQKHLTHNAALEKLDLIVQLSVQSFSENTPPLTPQEGQVWAVGPAPVNDWAGQAGVLAAYANGGWLFLAPQTGWRATLETEIRVWDGAAWVAPDLPDLQNVPGVGVNTSYDSTNKLAVAAAATLMTHDGAGHQLKVNKAASGDTASLVFQTGFSGRAEMGTLGDDSFGVKVSPDGTAWTTALSVDAATNATTVAELLLGSALSPAQGGTGVANDLAATLTRVGNHAVTLTTTAATSLTLPTAGTLATRDGTETLGNKTLSAPVINAGVTGTAVTQSAVDTTAGRLLKTGDAGVLGTTAPTISDLDAFLYGGLATNGANSGATGLPAAYSGMAIQYMPASVGSGAQFAVRANGADATEAFVRNRGSSVFGAWARLLHTRNIAGAVSQVGGVPTGAVMEYGSNANGKYVRLANGLQLCWHTLSLGGPTANGSGTRAAPFYTNSADWSLPAAFAVAPKFMGLACQGAPAPIGDRIFNISYATLTTTAVTYIRAHRASSGTDATAVAADVFALGLWF